MTKVVFLLVPGLHLLDLAGPAQAFGTAADLGCGYVPISTVPLIIRLKPGPR